MPQPPVSTPAEPDTGMRRYALSVLLVPLLCMAVVAVINRVIDPYQIFSAQPNGAYTDKPALHANMRLHKAFQVRLQKPDALILGSSKAIQGIPTDHDFLDGHQVYNLAMPLASMKELTLLLRHANSVNPVTHVLVGLDFLSFNTLARTDGPAAGFAPERLQGNEHSESPVNDIMSALLSLDALDASWQVLRERAHRHAEPARASLPEHRVLTGRGGRQDAEIRSRLLDGGHRSNTLKIEEFFTNAVYLPSPYRQFSFHDEGEDSLYWFGELLHTLHQNNIRASLFISPSHARLNELIDAATLWPQFEQWKRSMLSLTLKVAEDHGDTPYRLLDFSLPGVVTTEPFPEAGNSDYRMDYYFESIHFNQQTGALVLDRLKELDTGNAEAAMGPADFGVVLNADNIDDVLQQARIRQAEFRAQYPAYRSELEGIVAGR